MNRLLTQGVDALTVAFLAGHSDPSTLAKVYAHLSQNPAYLLDQVKKLPADGCQKRDFFFLGGRQVYGAGEAGGVQTLLRPLC